jgi:inorganic pyrophosphatase
MTDLSKAQPTPIRVETSMGALSLFPQRFEDIGAFSKLPIDEPSSTRLRLYLPYIAARSDALTENGEWPRIDEASSQQLPDEDVERIAEAYLSMPQRGQIAEASPLSSPIVRADGESATAYLDRILKADHERQMEDLKGTYESLRNTDEQPFSSALADVDRQASSLRDVATSAVQVLAGHDENRSPLIASKASREPPEVEVVIEVPRGSFLKRGSNGHVDFISPLPCPFNYGSVPSHLGLEDDLLDAVVLGPRLPLATRIRVKAWGAVTLTDRGMSDDKLICSSGPLDLSDRRKVLRFFHFYAKCKGLLNVWRRRPGRNACEGWIGAVEALARARPRDNTWKGPPVEF